MLLPDSRMFLPDVIESVYNPRSEEADTRKIPRARCPDSLPEVQSSFLVCILPLRRMALTEVGPKAVCDWLGLCVAPGSIDRNPAFPQVLGIGMQVRKVLYLHGSLSGTMASVTSFE